MATIIFNKQRWKTSTPPIYFTVTYDHRRSGADMEYKFYITVDPSGTASNGVPWRFGYNIISKLYLDGTLKDTHTLKASSPATWTNAITYESEYLKVTNKTTGSVSFKFNASSENGWTADFTSTLVVDAGVSGFTVNNGTLGVNQNITITRYNSSFTDSISYKYGSTTVDVVSKTSISNVPINVPISVSSQSPNGTSVSITFTITTYSGSTLIGKSSKTVSYAIPTSVIPTISSITTTEATSGIASKFGAFIQNKSTLNCTVNASGSYGSTIQSYSVTFQGESFSTRSFKTGIIQSTSAKMIAKVTDSRGRTATLEKTITATPYEEPNLKQFSVYRINTSGTEEEEGNRIAIALNYAISNVIASSDRTYKVEYRQGSSASFTLIEEGTASRTFSGTIPYTSAPNISPDYAYQIRFTLTDYFASVTKTIELPTAFTTFDINASGKGFAFGKVSEKDALEIDMVPWFYTGIGGTRLAQGSDFNQLLTTGKYIVWNNEEMESMLNRPDNITSGGHLYVIPFRNPAFKTITSSWQYLWQVYVSLTPSIYIRRIQSNSTASSITYTSWVKLTL